MNKLKDKDKNKGRKQDGPKTTTAKVWLAEAHKRKSGEEKGRKKKGTICVVVRPEDNETTPLRLWCFCPTILSVAGAAGGESQTPVTRPHIHSSSIYGSGHICRKSDTEQKKE